MLRFPLHSSPLQDESLDSWLQYLARLLECSPSTLLRAAGIHTRITGNLIRGVEDSFANLLSVATGVPTETIHLATLGRYDGLIADGGVDPKLTTSTAAYCPTCLLENSGRWRLGWHATSSMVCTIHNVLLVDRCPECGCLANPLTQRIAPSSSANRARNRPCIGGCLERLIETTPIYVDPDSQIIRSQQWIDNLLSSEFVEFPGVYRQTEYCRDVLRDLGKLRSLSSKFSEQFSPQNSVNSDILGVISDLDTSTAARCPRLPELVTQTLVAAAFTTRDQDMAASLLRFIPHEIRRRICYFHPMTDNPKAMTRSTRYLVYRYEFTHSQSNPPLWHRQVVTAAPVKQLSPAYLPSRAWPVVVANHPEVPEPAKQLVPLTSIVSIAAFGSTNQPVSKLSKIGLTLPRNLVDIELQSLWSSPRRRAILDYYLSLHEALSCSPPVIDYARRRKTFPTRMAIPTKLGLNPNETRFVWQLLTGSDPFATTGSSNQLGPVVIAYLRFVDSLPTDESRRLYNIAAGILHQSEIQGEPLVYSPTFENGKFVSTIPEISYNIPDLVLPGTHIVGLALAEKARSVESIVKYAIESNGAVARSLLLLLEIVDDPSATAAASRLKMHKPNIIMHETQIEQLLGRAIFTRARAGNPRAITNAGRELLRLCALRSEELHKSSIDGHGHTRGIATNRPESPE